MRRQYLIVLITTGHFKYVVTQQRTSQGWCISYLMLGGNSPWLLTDFHGESRADQVVALPDKSKSASGFTRPHTPFLGIRGTSSLCFFAPWRRKIQPESAEHVWAAKVSYGGRFCSTRMLGGHILWRPALVHGCSAEGHHSLGFMGTHLSVRDTDDESKQVKTKHRHGGSLIQPSVWMSIMTWCDNDGMDRSIHVWWARHWCENQD